MKKKKMRSLLSLFLAMIMVFGLISPMQAFASEEMTEKVLSNGDFETGNTSGWELSGFSSVVTDEWAENNSTYMLNLWLSDSEAAEGSASYAVELTAGTYYFTFDLSGANADSGLNYSVTAGEEVLASGDSTYKTREWDEWDTHTTKEFTLSEDTEVVFTLAGNIAAAYWGKLDNLKLFGTGSVIGSEAGPVDPGTGSESSIYVPKVEGTDGDFMRGVDISSLLSELNSGVTFKDWDGNSLGETVEEQGKGFFQLLAEAGVNWVRIRVWNDPYDAEGNGYGGGNCDVEAAKVMGKWATEAGLKVLIDFHYSDFWADPGKQMVPKAWVGFTADQKAEAIEAYTYDSLKTLLDAGVDVGMVQIGNETTGSICGERSWTNMAKLYSAGSNGVRTISAEREKEILVAVHFTNPESKDYAGYAKNLQNYGVDYDVFASSYYPYWHGTLENLTSKLKTVADTYDKQVIVAETSWAYTLKEADGHDDNIVKVGKNDGNPAYEFSVQGQATEVASIMQAVRNVGDKGVGLFYWEPAWIPVQVWDADAENAAEILAENKAIWEEHGSGWASSYASEYDPNDAGRYFGGSAMENQALFDFEGNPLESLNVFKYVQEGTSGVEVEITSIEAPMLVYSAGETLALPTTVKVTYNIGSSANVKVTWNDGDVATVDMGTPGIYKVRGTLEDGTEVICTVTVNVANLLQNPGFENSDINMYNRSQAYVKRTTEDPHSGSYGLHFYNSGAVSFTADQTVTLEAGTYTFSMYAQGDASTSGNIYAKFGETEVTAEFALAGWANWVNPVLSFTIEEATEVAVGVSAAGNNGAWGTFDDWYLSEALSTEEPDKPTPPAGGMALGSDISAAADTDKSYTNKDGVSKKLYDICSEDYGMNVARLRTWVDHSRGSCNEEKIIAYAKKCYDAGLRVMIDFHYADNWADPGKQPPPSAWKVTDDISFEEAKRVGEELYNYTYNFLTNMIEAGVTPEWVQVGNEITNGMLWPLCNVANYENFTHVLQRGIDAVRDASPETKVVIHIDNGASTEIVIDWYERLVEAGVTDFDVMGLSFYPSDHDPTSSIESLTNTFDGLYEKFCVDTDREIMVVEIGANYLSNATVNQKHNMLVNVINELKAIPDGRGTGCIYWEIENYEMETVRENNVRITRPNRVWEAFSPNAQLINDNPVTAIELAEGAELTLQQNDVHQLQVNVTPAQPDITKMVYTSSNPEVCTVGAGGQIKALNIGESIVTVTNYGGANGEYETFTQTCKVTVIPEQPGLKNGGFELGDNGIWKFDPNNQGIGTLGASANSLNGNCSLHFSSGSDDTDFRFYQDIEGLAPGIYRLTGYIMGDTGVSTIKLFANTTEENLTSQAYKTTGWGGAEKFVPMTLNDIVVLDGKLRVGAHVTATYTGTEAWGDFDDFALELVQPIEAFKILTNPADCKEKVGDNAEFTVEAQGEGLSYQWQYQNATSNKWFNSSMAGADTATVSVPVTNLRDGQKYRCIVTDAKGNELISEAAVMSVLKSEVVITTQPEDFEGAVGDMATFTVKAEGEIVSYQWQYKNATSSKWYNSSMTGADTETVSVPVANYRNGQSYRCLITDDKGIVVISEAGSIQVVNK